MDNFIKKLNNNNLSNKDKNWWKPAIEIFSQVSIWIVVPIVVALMVGKNLDARFDTKPWIFLGLAVFGFFISSFGIFRIISRYMKQIEDISPDVKSGSRPESVGSEESNK